MDARNQSDGGANPLPSNQTTTVSREVAELEYSSISWKAIFAGSLISLLTYGILMSLGFAVGGSELQNVIRGENAEGLGIGSGVWIALSAFIALFVGSYFGGRASGFITAKLGGVQGAVISALFFGFLLSQTVSAIGMLGKGVGSAAGAVGGALGDVVSNPEVQQSINQALEGQTVNIPPSELAQGLATRILRGDTQGARDYLVRNSTLTNEQADQILANIERNAKPAAEKVAQASAKAVSVVGWTLFFAMTLGTVFAVIGGTAGARARIRKPFSAKEVREVRNTRAA